MNIFLAGASGTIGRRLIPLLLADGHSVTGTTRVAEKAPSLQAAGIRPVVVDVLHAEALRRVVAEAQPQVIIHQLTDLPRVLAGPLDAATLGRNARLRIEGTAYLLEAARSAGARRFIAQSLAFLYAGGRTPHEESDPLIPGDGDSAEAITARGVRALEDGTLNTPGIEGLVLRYGWLYGPGTWFEAPHQAGSLHVDAAARAAALAVTHGTPGIYNIADEDGTVSIDKARAELGFDPGFRSRGV